MKSTTHHPHQELQELSHEEQPGYRKAFFVALIVTASVLIISFLMAGEVTTQH